jgi:uncharacterized delta-60 repeat protein
MIQRKIHGALTAGMLWALAFCHVAAAPGNLDKTFGKHGKVVTVLTPGEGVFPIAQSIAVQSDGKILVAESTCSMTGPFKTVAVVRYNSDGALDASFNGTGETTPVQGELNVAMALQGDGKIVVLTGNRMRRYDGDGTLDVTFNGTGTVQDSALSDDSSVAIQGDGKIVLTGGSGFAAGCTRYNSDGSLDTGFGTMGTATADIGAEVNDVVGQSIAIQPDGKILVAGWLGNPDSLHDDFAVVRYNPDGSLDTGFGGTGVVTSAIGIGDSNGEGVALQADGKIVVSGICEQGYFAVPALVRYNADGSLDTSFGKGGVATHGFGGQDAEATGVVVQSNGGIVELTTRSIDQFSLLRYNPDGSLDKGFHGNGQLKVSFGNSAYNSQSGVSPVALQNDGKIVIAGEGLPFPYFPPVSVPTFRIINPPNRQHLEVFRYLGDPPFDALISKPGGIGFVGEGISNQTGNHQTVETSLAVGRPKTFTVKVRNNGNSAASFVVQGSAASKGFAVAYSDETSADITSEVVAGKYAISGLAAGAEKTLSFTVQAESTAKPGAVQKCQVIVNPDGAPDNSTADVVIAKVAAQ